MFQLLIIITLFITGIVLIQKYKHLKMISTWSNYHLGKTLLYIATVFTMISVFVNFANYGKQIESFEKAREIHQRIDILQERYWELYAVFNKHLAQEYPEIEKEIFSQISPEKAPNLKFILINYPQIKSSSTLMKLVDETKMIANSMYDERINAQALYTEIRYRKESPWIYLKKSIPEDIVKEIYSLKQ